MKRRTFLKGVAAAAIAPAIPVASLATAEPMLRVFTNGCDTVIAESLDLAKEIVSKVYHGKPLRELTADERGEYIEGPDGWSERTDLDDDLEIGNDEEPVPTVRTLRQWIAKEGVGYLCIDGEYC